MFELVPSNYMRDIFQEQKFEFTDFQKATLIWNAPKKNREDKLAALLELSETTDDEKLCQQIRERIEYEEEALRRFMDNSSDKYVYVIEEDYTYSCGFFAEYNMARDYLLKCLDKDEITYAIEKQMIVRDKSNLTVRNREKWNPNLFAEPPKTQEYEYHYGFETSRLDFDKDGNIKCVYSGEMSEEEEWQVHAFKKERFESHFIQIPFFGWSGVPVRNVTDNTYGILMTDTEQWEKYLQNIKNRNLYVDFSDIQVEVYFLSEQGIWRHKHINPMYLEIEVYPYTPGDEKSEAYMHAMETFIEYWSKGESRNEDNEDYEKRAIRTAREYRDACLKYRADEEKRKCDWVDRAETIYDIMN